jgi:hypothetical protein
MIKVLILFSSLVVNILYANDVVTIKKCQYYDNFKDKCLYYKKTLILKKNNNTKCKEKCQYWDSFFGKCLYETKCKVIDDGFIKTKCQYWDSFFNKCKEEEEDYIFFEKEETKIIIIN